MLVQCNQRMTEYVFTHKPENQSVWLAIWNAEKQYVMHNEMIELELKHGSDI